MEPKFVTKPAFSVAGLLYHGKPMSSEIPQLWTKFMEQASDVQQGIHPEVCYGVCDHFDEKTGDFDYLAAVEVVADAVQTAPIVKWDLPAQEYAVFTTTLPKIGETFDYIYQRWLPGSGYQRGMGPEFEFYPETFEPEDPASEFDVAIPVKKN